MPLLTKVIMCNQSSKQVWAFYEHIKVYMFYQWVQSSKEVILFHIIASSDNQMWGQQKKVFILVKHAQSNSKWKAKTSQDRLHLKFLYTRIALNWKRFVSIAVDFPAGLYSNTTWN